MTDVCWSDLCDSGDEDDEDYDPFKDISQPEGQEDSDSESFEALRHLLSPKKPRRAKGAQGGAAGGSGAGASSDHSPIAQAHWHTRQHGKLPDDVWLQTDSLLEKAEMALDPLSPGAQSDSFQNEMLANCTNPEYLRLLAVARGEREPEEEDDEEDADFVPEEEDDGEGAAHRKDDESGAQLSVSNAELSALIADNRGRGNGGVSRDSEVPGGNSPSRRARPSESGAVQQSVAEEVQKQARPQRRRRDKRKRDPGSVVRVLPFPDVNGLMPSASSASGFSREQCIQLQGQLREYLQLSLQQYVVNCCSPDKNVPQRAEDIKNLHQGIAEMYQHWEVSREYGQMQSKALEYLAQFRVGRTSGGKSAVQIVEQSRFTFFDVPGISLVPSLLEEVSKQCSSQPGIPEAGSIASGQARNESAEGGKGNCGQAGSKSDAAERAHEKSVRILEMFRQHFDDSLIHPAPGAVAREGGSATSCGGAVQFTKAEDALLLIGLKRFGCESGSWERIRAHVLPTKQTNDIRARYKRLIGRYEEGNDVKSWKLSLATDLSSEETELLQKGVKYFGTRFDLISEKVLTERSEAELKRAYDKLISKHTRFCKRAPQYSASNEGCGDDGDDGSRGGASTTMARGGKRRTARKKKGFHSDLLADRSPSAGKRRRLGATEPSRHSLMAFVSADESPDEAGAAGEDEDYECEVWCTRYLSVSDYNCGVVRRACSLSNFESHLLTLVP